MFNAVILGVVVLAGGILLLPRLANSPLWRASITPLASIIGSGFLVLGPILDVSFGGYAPLVMLGLCVISYLFGGAIRYNIHRIDNEPERPPFVQTLETAASSVLAFAFIISVAYYLNLFGAFGVSLTSQNDAFHARLLTSAIFMMILIVGWTRGFLALERMEQVSVGIKLAIIAGLIAGLIENFASKANHNALQFDTANVSGWAAFTLMGGLIVTVQGFETSRYLGATYDAETRIKSMRLAQLLSALIYFIYIGLLTYAFDFSAVTLSETAIIHLMESVAPILPLLLIAAALSAQFSAAVADTSGSGGLIAEITKGAVSAKLAYALLVGVGLLLTWTIDIFDIISYASRAFAAYYGLQAAIAAISCHAEGNKVKTALFAFAATLAFAITVFGVAVE